MEIPIDQIPYSIVQQLLNFGLLVCAVTPYQNVSMKELVPSLLDGSTEHNFLIEHAIAPALNATGSKANANQTLTELAAWLETTGPFKNNGPAVIRVYAIMSAVTFCVVALRLWVRKFMTGAIRKEDWATLVACLSAAFYAMIMSLNESFGYSGRHIWDLSWEKIKKNLLFLFFSEIFYPPVLGLVKSSIIIFYWGLIPHRTFHRILIGCFVAVGLMTIWGIFVITFQCNPIPYWRDPLHAKCIDRKPLWTAWGVCNIFVDWTLLFLPMPIICKLRIKTREKVIIIGMFAIGAFVCIASVNRVVATNSFIHDPDHTYKSSASGIWGLVEIDLAIIISCVPALKALVVRYAPGWLGHKSDSQVVDLRHTPPEEFGGRRASKKKPALDLMLETKESNISGHTVTDNFPSGDVERQQLATV